MMAFHIGVSINHFWISRALFRRPDDDCHCYTAYLCRIEFYAYYHLILGPAMLMLTRQDDYDCLRRRHITFLYLTIITMKPRCLCRAMAIVFKVASRNDCFTAIDYSQLRASHAAKDIHAPTASESAVASEAARRPFNRSMLGPCPGALLLP